MFMMCVCVCVCVVRVLRWLRDVAGCGFGHSIVVICEVRKCEFVLMVSMGSLMGWSE